VQEVTERIADVSRDAAVNLERADDIRAGSARVAESITALRSRIVCTIRTATADTDRRTHTRVQVNAGCVVKLGSIPHSARLLDISQSGARIESPQEPVIGSGGILVLDRLGQQAEAGFTIRSRHPDGSFGVVFDSAALSPAFRAQVNALSGGAGEQAA